MRLRRLSHEATTRLELKTIARRLVTVAVTVVVVGRVFVEDCGVSIGEGKRFVWRENIVMVPIIPRFFLRFLVD